MKSFRLTKFFHLLVNGGLVVYLKDGVVSRIPVEGGVPCDVTDLVQQMLIQEQRPDTNLTEILCVKTLNSDVNITVGNYLYDLLAYREDVIYLHTLAIEYNKQKGALNRMPDSPSAATYNEALKFKDSVANFVETNFTDLTDGSSQYSIKFLDAFCGFLNEYVTFAEPLAASGVCDEINTWLITASSFFLTVLTSISELGPILGGGFCGVLGFLALFLPTIISTYAGVFTTVPQAAPVMLQPLFVSLNGSAVGGLLPLVSGLLSSATLLASVELSPACVSAVLSIGMVEHLANSVGPAGQEYVDRAFGAYVASGLQGVHPGVELKLSSYYDALGFSSEFAIVTRNAVSQVYDSAGACPQSEYFK